MLKPALLRPEPNNSSFAVSPMTRDQTSPISPSSPHRRKSVTFAPDPMIRRFSPHSPEHEDIIPVVSFTDTGPRNLDISLHGPPPPSVDRLLKLTSTTALSAAADMLLEDASQLNQIEEELLKWGPVLAKASLLGRCGLMSLISAERTGEAVATTLAKRGEKSINTFREHLLFGWRHWPYRISRADVDQFLNGQHEEAEKAAKTMLRLAAATDPTNIFALFLR